MKNSLYIDEFSLNDIKTKDLLNQFNIGFEIDPVGEDNDGFIEEKYMLSFEMLCINYDSSSGNTKMELTDHIINEYEKLIKSHLLWTYCKSKIYIENFNKLTDSFINEFDGKEEMFIDKEIKNFKKLLEPQKHIPNSIKIKIDYSTKSKIKFLEEKKKELTFGLTENDFLIDLSNTKGVEKVIYLKELGVLDFLKEKIPFNTSNNRLANVLSAITGIDTKSLYANLNPVLKNDMTSKNNPYNTDKTVAKVKKQLNDIGFNN